MAQNTLFNQIAWLLYYQSLWKELISVLYILQEITTKLR